MTDGPSERDLIPISLVAHQAFCPRRAWLEAAGETTDTRQMAVGTAAHAASDDVAASRPRRVRAVDVISTVLGVSGRCDTVEVGDDDSLTVVEHKATPVRRRPEVTWPMRAQVALQSIALAEMGHRVAGCVVSFTTHGVRVPVELTDDERAQVVALVAETRATLTAVQAPPPLEDDPRCLRCSHIGVCLPDERALEPVTRRVVVADPDAQVLHLATPGARATISGGRVQVARADERLASIPIERVQGVVVHGNVDLSGALIRELMWRSLAVVWCSSSGTVIGWSRPARGPNGAPRVRQHLASGLGRLDLAREFVAAKVHNQATLLRRRGDDPNAVRRLRQLQRDALTAPSRQALYGIEGDGAAQYFAGFPTMLATQVREAEQLTFTTRTRRPARDPVNAALNFCYGLLVADIVRALVACGLDPHAGFLHSSERNKPALALDLAEEFRAPVADSVVLGAFNNGELKRRDFTDVLGTTRLRPSGRTALLTAHERRVTGRFRHPLFGYEVSWRRAMEVQARLVLGVVDGTQPRYVGIRTR